MKVRCKGCGKVVKTESIISADKCPECGYMLADSTQWLSTPTVPVSQFRNISKGKLPTRNKSMRNVGCLIMVVLLFGIPMLIAGITEGDNDTYYILAIGALIVIVSLGVWFERNTIRRK